MSKVSAKFTHPSSLIPRHSSRTEYMPVESRCQKQLWYNIRNRNVLNGPTTEDTYYLIL